MKRPVKNIMSSKPADRPTLLMHSIRKETIREGRGMAQEMIINGMIENSRQEILFAIKERICAMTRGTSAPIQLHGLITGNRNGRGRDMYFYEISNVYIDDDNRLCGDLAGKEERLCDDILFGKDLEDLPVDDLKQVLDLLYTDRWNIDVAEYDCCVDGRRDGLYGFLMSRKAGISRLLRRGA